MPQVSKHPISGTVAERIFSIFIKSFIALKEKNDADDFASDFFTPTEKIMLAKRLSIAFLLLKRYQYREISRILKVSVGTIASVNITLKRGKGSHQRVLKKIMQEEDMEEFFNNTIVSLLAAPSSASKGSGLWRYLRDEAKKNKQKKTF